MCSFKLALKPSLEVSVRSAEHGCVGVAADPERHWIPTATILSVGEATSGLGSPSLEIQGSFSGFSDVPR